MLLSSTNSSPPKQSAATNGEHLESKRDNPFTPDHSKRSSHRAAANKKIREKVASPFSTITTTTATLTPIRGSRSAKTIEARKKKEEEEKRLLLSPASKNRPKAQTLSAGSLDSLGGGGLRGTFSHHSHSHSRLSMSTTSSLAASSSSCSLQMPQQLTMEQRNKKFEEWIKIATDNKITTKNSWNVSLIEYFSELTFLRNDKQKSSINFQKASCTLDGCVKIYSTRVDSVADETGKLLNGLTSSDNSFSINENDDGSDCGSDNGDNDFDDDDDNNKNKNNQRHSKRAPTKRKPSSTIEMKPEALLMKIPETLIPQNDPLFRRTCVMFDTTASLGQESICSRLPLSARGTLLFEGSIGEVEDMIREGSGVGGDVGSDRSNENNYNEGEDDGFFGDNSQNAIDVSDIFSNTASLDTTTSNSFLPSLPSHSLPGRASDVFLEIPLEQAYGDIDDDDDDDGDVVEYEYEASNEAMDFDAGLQGGDSTTATNAVYKNDNQREESISQAAAAMMLFGTAGTTSEFVVDDGDGEGDGDYMQQYGGRNNANSTANWAGVQHWKVQRPYLMAAAAAAGSTSSGTTGSGSMSSPASTKKKSKDSSTAVVLIDFERPLSVDHLEKAQTTTLLSRAQLDERSRGGGRGVKNVLPHDYHFDVDSLFNLFTLKNTRIPMHRRRVIAGSRVDGFDGFDTNHNAQDGYDDFAADPADHSDAALTTAATTSIIGPTTTTATNTDIMSDMVSVIPQGYSSLSASDSHENTNRRLKAKNVDIQLLKKELWDAVLQQSKSQTTTLTFASLTRTYPKGGDITSSYIFICLLHIANENNLLLENTDGDIGDIRIVV